jgi:hypothetical protein
MQMNVVTSHAAFPIGTEAILAGPMAGSTLTPSKAVEQLRDMSPEIRAGVLLDSRHRLSASTEEDRERAAEMRALVVQLLRLAEEAGGEAPAQLEVSTAAGAVFAVRGQRHVLAAIASRGALPSLMFYDLRSVLSRLDRKAA